MTRPVQIHRAGDAAQVFHPSLVQPPGPLFARRREHDETGDNSDDDGSDGKADEDRAAVEEELRKWQSDDLAAMALEASRMAGLE